MDSMIFDVSHIAASDEDLMCSSIDVVGEQFPLDKLIKDNQSLGYEVLTSIGSRYKRTYLSGVI
jgi:alanine racemase